jgi:hypothetical protein
MERAVREWGHIHAALAASPDAADRALAQEVRAFVERMPMVEHLAGLERQRQQVVQQSQTHGPDR